MVWRFAERGNRGQTGDVWVRMYVKGLMCHQPLYNVVDVVLRLAEGSGGLRRLVRDYFFSRNMLSTSELMCMRRMPT